MIIVIIVAIVVTYLTWGSTSEFWAGVLANMGASTTTAASVGAALSAATAAALGSVASQAVGIAIGVQDKFSWKSVAVAALTAGITKGIGVDKLALVGDKVAGADVFNSFADAGLDRILDFDRAQGDRVRLEPGSNYALSQEGADTVASLVGGGRVVLVGVTLASLDPGWIFVG